MNSGYPTAFVSRLHKLGLACTTFLCCLHLFGAPGAVPPVSNPSKPSASCPAFPMPALQISYGTPQFVDSGSTYVQLTGGSYTVCALTAAGSVDCWSAFCSWLVCRCRCSNCLPRIQVYLVDLNCRGDLSDAGINLSGSQPTSYVSCGSDYCCGIQTSNGSPYCSGRATLT